MPAVQARLPHGAAEGPAARTHALCPCRAARPHVRPPHERAARPSGDDHRSPPALRGLPHLDHPEPRAARPALQHQTQDGRREGSLFPAAGAVVRLHAPRVHRALLALRLRQGSPRQFLPQRLHGGPARAGSAGRHPQGRHGRPRRVRHLALLRRRRPRGVWGRDARCRAPRRARLTDRRRKIQQIPPPGFPHGAAVVGARPSRRSDGGCSAGNRRTHFFHRGGAETALAGACPSRLRLALWGRRTSAAMER